MKKTIFSVLFIVLGVVVAIGTISSAAATFENTSNDDLSVLISTDNYYGNHIADLVTVNIVVLYKTDGVVISENFPRTGTFGDFDIVKATMKTKKDRTEIAYQLQTFLPPRFFPAPQIGPIELNYTAGRYWSEKDQRFIYQKINTRAFPIFQSSLDPDDHVPLIYEFNYFPNRAMLINLLAVFGLLLLLIPLYPGARSVVNRYARNRSYYRNRAFIKKIIDDDLSYYNIENVCRKLNTIKTNDLLIRVLYQQYTPEESEIKEVALETLKCLEIKNCHTEAAPEALK